LNSIKKTAVILLLQILFIQSGWSLEIEGTISGVQSEGPVYIFIVTKEEMSTPAAGRYMQVLNPAPGADTIKYSFSNIPAGTYGIRIFQDLNSNGKLDKGLFGPSEPWDLSWTENKKIIPEFKDISFYLSENRIIDFGLKK